MYYPYLYGRKYELLALRDFATNHPGDRNVSPVVEPLKSDVGDLKRAIQRLSSQNFPLTVILNPVRGEFRDQANLSGWLSSLTSQVTPTVDFTPALLCDDRVSYADVDNFLNQFRSGSAVLVYNSPALSAIEVSRLDQDSRVGLQVIKAGGIEPQARGGLSPQKTIEILDCFNAQTRNADYGGAEFFSRQYLGFRQASCGYGDFTVLSTAIPGSGGPPGAVVVHATYKEPNSGEVWVEHFVSAETDREAGTVEGKFLDAAGQLCRQVASRPGEFGANVAISSYQAQVAGNRSPGLGGNKRQQILHHICLNRQILLGYI
ncbi:sce7725 family protein [Halomonas borealis]|uniref:sce7725 family protein n=1 Tax=Halomonas borealis TaxID=2508710 RepID=UPI00109EEA95|nr:sce7725 family protein [Halomonas borealis]